MKIVAFTKNIRFRLTMWYTSLLVVLVLSLVLLTDAVMINTRPSLDDEHPDLDSAPSWQQLVVEDREDIIHDFLVFALIGTGVVVLIGAFGGYIIAEKMLRPIDHVSTLASRISQTNLSERIGYQGSNDELKRLADTFDEMLERLEKAFISKQQFIQDASHELRTPISIMQTNLEVLEMDPKATQADYRKLTQVIKLSLDRLSDVGDNLLLLSEADSSQAYLEPVNINQIIEEISAEFQNRANASRIKLRIAIESSSPIVEGNPFRLKQAITNVVDNAIKYNKPGGEVIVSAYSLNKTAIIEVKDTGIGIDPGDVKRIFERFFRVDKSRSRDRGGSGLGLSIVQKIIGDHKGLITVESHLGEGTTFRISIPMPTL